MQQPVTFDYFYGRESELFSYYRIPRLLVTGGQFKYLSTDAKLLYGLLLDRMGLSAKNGWYDTKGRVYIYYPLEEVETDLGCSHGKAVKLMAELDRENGIGLIERVRQGLGKPSIIYVKQFIGRAVPRSMGPPILNARELPEVQKLNFMKCKNRTSGHSITEPQEVQNLDFPYNNKNYLNNSYLYPSINQSVTEPIDAIDRNRCRELVKEKIGYIAFREQQRPEVDELVELITDVLCSPQASYRIGGAQFKSQIVRERLSGLEQQHIEYVLDCMKKNTTKVRNIRGYLLTALYNAPTTIEHYYQSAVQHDLYGQQSEPGGGSF